MRQTEFKRKLILRGRRRVGTKKEGLEEEKLHEGGVGRGGKRVERGKRHESFRRSTRGEATEPVRASRRTVRDEDRRKGSGRDVSNGPMLHKSNTEVVTVKDLE